ALHCLVAMVFSCRRLVLQVSSLRYFLLFLYLCRFMLSVLVSFPTRRSSDLFVLSFAVGGLLFGFDASSVHLSAVDGEVLEWSRTDRKSTRLKSSHVSSSYSVFWL